MSDLHPGGMRLVMRNPRLLVALLAGVVLAPLAVLRVAAAGEQSQNERRLGEQANSDSDDSEPAKALNEAERAFVDLLTNSVLVGRFSIDGAEPGKANTERYAITKVTKTGGDNWIVEARITYGNVDIPVPVPVKVHWAGDTPVISLTGLKIPGLGEGFTTRVLFYEDRYAGSWYHGKVGGHMWGRIEKGDRKPPDGTEPAP